MLTNTFIILERVGYKTEENIWKQDISTWDDFLSTPRIRGVSKEVKVRHDESIRQAEYNLEEGNTHYFRRCLYSREHWRLYKEFKEDACFLDIETTGLSPYNGDVTVVGISDGQETKALVKDISLTEDALIEELAEYKLLLTFYGSGFDIPFLQAKYPRLNLDIPHVDLCFTGRRAGLTGGLKYIERQLGIAREDEIQGMDGFEAVRLWNRWEKQGDQESLDKLIEYNRADTANLKTLADIIYEKLKDQTGYYR